MATSSWSRTGYISYQNIWMCDVCRDSGSEPDKARTETSSRDLRRIRITEHYSVPRAQTGQMFTARFADAIFNETEFPKVGEANGGVSTMEKSEKEISHLFQEDKSQNQLDPRTNACKLEVRKILNLSRVADEIPDAFVDTVKTQKSHIPAANAPIDIHVQDEHTVPFSSERKLTKRIYYGMKGSFSSLCSYMLFYLHSYAY